MIYQDIKRNGRGQIVSYEIVGVNDSTVSTLQYGYVEFTKDNKPGTVVDKYSSTSFSNEINVVVSDELIDSDTIINPQITLGDIVSETDTRATGENAPNVGLGNGGSIDTFPFGDAGTFVGEIRIFTRPDGADESYEWVGTFWQPV